MAEFRLKIFTPAGLVLEDSAREVKLPTEAGEIGILPQHARYCGILGNGQMEYLPAHLVRLKNCRCGVDFAVLWMRL
jgi:F0F1-type ATP synthase epsilon subunit